MYKRKNGESEKAYIYRVCSMKDAIGTWYDVRDILNAELGYNWTESAYRKQYQQGQAYLIENQDMIYEQEEYLQKLRDERAELQKERYKLQTEKAEYNKWLREDARDDLFREKIIDAIVENVGTYPPIVPIPTKRNERCGILCLADMHFGADFTIKGLKGETLNSYSPEIFYERMGVLLGETIDYLLKENLHYIKVFNLGDSLDGFLRNSQLLTLRYGVVDSAIKFGDFMADWLHELSRYAAVEYYQTSGNHGELRLLDGRKGEHEHENIEKITGHIIKTVNMNNPNFEYIENESGYIFTEAVGFNILGVHGEVKDVTQAIKEFAEVYNTPISYLVAGHKHHNSYDNCGVRKGCIGIGSIMGIDDYAMKLRKSSDPTASLIIFEKDKGKTDEHTFVLN